MSFFIIVVMMPITIMSLFSGAGGLDCGFELYNRIKNEKIFHILWANDVDRATCETYAHNFQCELYDDPMYFPKGDAIFCGDIRNIAFNILHRDKSIDLIVGGFPCKDFSIIRGSENENRKGVDVRRGKLYLEFVRAIATYQPKMFLAENVQGLLSANKGLAFKQILKDFKHLNHEWNDMCAENPLFMKPKKSIPNYHIIHKDVVDFSQLGVPQQRKRIILIGVRNDIHNIMCKKDRAYTRKLQRWLHPAHDFSTHPLTPLEVLNGNILPRLQKEYYDDMHAYNEYITTRTCNTNEQRQFQHQWKSLTFDCVKDYCNLYGVSTNPPSLLDITENEWKKQMKNHVIVLKTLGYWKRNVHETKYHDNTQQLLSDSQDSIDRISLIPPHENIEFLKGTDGFDIKTMMSNYWRRIHPLIPANTIIGAGGGGTWSYHYKRDRCRLTHRERARLQTFPDWFEFKGTDSEIRMQIGNAVPTYGAFRIAMSVLKIFKVM